MLAGHSFLVLQLASLAYIAFALTVECFIIRRIKKSTHLTSDDALIATLSVLCYMAALGLMVLCDTVLGITIVLILTVALRFVVYGQMRPAHKPRSVARVVTHYGGPVPKKPTNLPTLKT